VEALAEQHGELGGDRHDERAEGHRQRVELDAEEEQDEPGPARGQDDRRERDERAPPGAQRGEQDERDGGQAGEQEAHPAQGRGDARVGVRGEDGQAGEVGPHPARRVELAAHGPMTSPWRSTLMRRIPNATDAVRRSSLTTPRAK
jgi:hypothetical protein